jgi:hypothetical protein
MQDARFQEFRDDDAAEHASDPTADASGNDLHAGVGQVCPICSREIMAGQPVRRRLNGSYQHDNC